MFATFADHVVVMLESIPDGLETLEQVIGARVGLKEQNGRDG